MADSKFLARAPSLLLLSISGRFSSMRFLLACLASPAISVQRIVETMARFQDVLRFQDAIAKRLHEQEFFESLIEYSVEHLLLISTQAQRESQKTFGGSRSIRFEKQVPKPLESALIENN